MEKVSPTSVKEFCLNYILRYIHQNRLSAGDRLPAAGELCNMMGVSLTSVREALKVLETRGTVETINGKGTYVRETPDGDIVISSGIPDASKNRQLIEIFEVRKCLERQVIENVRSHATREELDRVQNRLDRLMFRYNHGLSTVVEDRLFHREFYSVCHNRLLQRLVDSVIDAFHQMYPYDTGFNVVYADTVPFHEEMFRCLLKWDLPRAQAANDAMMERVIFRLTNDR